MDQFSREVEKGLSSSPKFLPSKFFYDEEGDRLFQRIMEMKEYYPTDSEFEIFTKYREDLLQIFSDNSMHPFNLVEFGAGDGYKTKILLEYFLRQEATFKYHPIDISVNAIDQLVGKLKRQLPA